MLRNLRAEMSRYNVRAKDFAKLLKINEWKKLKQDVSSGMSKDEELRY